MIAFFPAYYFYDRKVKVFSSISPLWGGRSPAGFSSPSLSLVLPSLDVSFFPRFDLRRPPPPVKRSCFHDFIWCELMAVGFFTGSALIPCVVLVSRVSWPFWSSTPEETLLVKAEVPPGLRLVLLVLSFAVRSIFSLEAWSNSSSSLFPPIQAIFFPP